MLAGGGFVTAALGRLRALSCRHKDRRVRCSLHWDCFGAGNARDKVRGLRLTAVQKIARSGLSRKAWPGAEPWATNVPLARAAVERREASCPLPFPPPLAGEGEGGGSAAPQGAAGTDPRLSAFCFLFIAGSESKRFVARVE